MSKPTRNQEASKRRAHAIALTATQDVRLPFMAGMVLLGIGYYVIALFG
jgi:hypothetical protein